ncbi:UDP-2,3-diacylglucosamine diphosphatase [Hydrogenophaga sp. RWCD_12]|uniref:UDP-2,3-diacylglucosamine diphosphatase n=1 Tax=Hydrogenophaga sp. RWCD_12 TaxID=3391190 RepID=UPI0039856109
MATDDRFAAWRAPAHWQAVDFISDLHLQAAQASTVQAWLNYLRAPAIGRPDALVILGDLFEVWIGDDALNNPNGFASHCARALRTFSQTTPTYFLCGNRDFLLGDAALVACGMLGLSDPTSLDFQGQRWLLSHGDALCLDDTDYQGFRAQVRSADWQQAFLSRPLAEREAVARDLRERSEARKQSMAHDPELWADVDAAAAREWLQRAGAPTLIHGHTHRPAEHDLGNGLRRVVLSDWDADARPPRLEVLRLTAGGLQRLPLA